MVSQSSYHERSISDLPSPKHNLPNSPQQLYPHKPDHSSRPLPLRQWLSRHHTHRLDLPPIRNINPLPNLRTRHQAPRPLQDLHNIHARNSRAIHSRHNLHRRQHLHHLHSNNNLPKHLRPLSLPSHHRLWRCLNPSPHPSSSNNLQQRRHRRPKRPILPRRRKILHPLRRQRHRQRNDSLGLGRESDYRRTGTNASS
jgi:hypothetical protein